MQVMQRQIDCDLFGLSGLAHNMCQKISKKQQKYENMCSWEGEILRNPFQIKQGLLK